MARPVYFDCDTGVDDALALLYLLACPEVELVGVGTVSGNTDAAQAAENTVRLLALAGRGEVPVAVGEHDFLARAYAWRPVEIHGRNGLGDVELPAGGVTPVAERAAAMLVRLAREYAGALEVVSVGPMTNLARALELDPGLPGRVKQVTSMGGAALVPGNVTPVAEANVWNDPEAARLVTEAPWPVTLVGLDVTLENVLEESHRERLLGAERPVARAMGEILDVYFDFYSAQFGRRCSALHDPLAAAIGVGDIRPVDSPWVPVVVDDTAGPGRGQTIADLRGQRLGPVDHADAHTRMVLRTDRALADGLTETIITGRSLHWGP